MLSTIARCATTSNAMRDGWRAVRVRPYRSEVLYQPVVSVQEVDVVTEPGELLLRQG